MHRVVTREQSSDQSSEGSFPMNGIGKQATFYRGYLPDDRSLVPLTVLLSTTLALWLLVYLVAGVVEADQDAGARQVACGQCTRTIEEVASLVVYATQAFVTAGSALRGGGIVKPIV
jgi:hypothetical protein